MVFAPVIIPTFNRISHLKRCVESLARCVGSSETEVFIGVDFPKQEEYLPGFEQICSYVKTITGFKKTNIYIRERNLGVMGNVKDLKMHVRNAGYDRFILSEDDNEFSPNFLLYINQGLERYKDDTRVMAICGYSHPDKCLEYLQSCGSNIYTMQGYFAWGAGLWFSHEEEFNRFHRSKELVFSWTLAMKLFKKGMFQTVHRLISRYTKSGADLRRCAYCVLEDRYCIFPMVPKVRNWGFDGSGINCAVIDSYAARTLDDSDSFSMDEIDLKITPELKKVRKEYYGRGILGNAIIFIEYVYFRITGHAFKDFNPIKSFMSWRAGRSGKEDKAK